MEGLTELTDTAPLTAPKDVAIDVIAKDDGKGGVDWSLDIKTSGHGKDNKLDLPKDFNYKLKFSLVTKLDLRFDAQGPIFVREGGAGPCPTAISTGQIMVDSCDAGLLVVTDWNYGDPRELYYQLNFVNKKGLSPVPYDPQITNGGGGTH